MHVIHARNVHDALPKAVELIRRTGVQRDSRNGPVLQCPSPVATVYDRPMEKVVFWPERDANPFLHLYESLWMLAGRRDVAPLLRYTKQFAEYSDDGYALHGAYGYRWRMFFNMDQLRSIVKLLQKNRLDRRAVLQMWDPFHDLGSNGKDVPCNLTATFQIDHLDRLNMVVFCRSNDIVWGAYGANAVHFAFLLEYLSLLIGVQPGTYTQVSVNWHAYSKTFAPIAKLSGYINDVPLPQDILHPYETDVCPFPLAPEDISMAELDAQIKWVLQAVDTQSFAMAPPILTSGLTMIFQLLWAHYLHTKGDTSDALDMLRFDDNFDWVKAGRQWLQRRLLRQVYGV